MVRGLSPFVPSLVNFYASSPSEKDNPPEKFRDFFQRIKEEGINVTAHAGEEGPPQHVWKSLQDIGVR